MVGGSESHDIQGGPFVAQPRFGPDESFPLTDERLVGAGPGLSLADFLCFRTVAQVGESNPIRSSPLLSCCFGEMWSGFDVAGHIADMSKPNEKKLAMQGKYCLNDAEWAAEAVGGYYKPRMTRFKVWNFEKKAMKAMKEHDRKQ